MEASHANASQSQRSCIVQSIDWFQDRGECVKDAKIKFQDDYKATKRVITKTFRKLPICADEVDMVNKMKLVEGLLTLCYCLEVTKIIKRLLCELSFGCMFDTEGEQVHTCHDMPEQDQVDKYFNTAMIEVSDDHVLDNWLKLLADDSSLKHVTTFSLIPYQCKDYRDSQFKTPERLNDLKQRVVKMLLLEKRF